PLEDVAARVDLPIQIASLARHANLGFNELVVRFELLETEGPVFDRRSARDPRRAVAAGRLAHDLEIPRIETPALRPVMERCSSDRVHHRMDGRPGRVRCRCTWPMRRHFAIRL